MTSAAPWSVKGIDPKAREIAKDLARRSGMTLGEWLNQMIIDGEPEAPPPIEAPYARAEPVRRQAPAQPAYQSAGHGRRAYDEEADVAAVTRALEQLSARMEAAEHRSTLAISGIDQSVMGVLARMDGVERDVVSTGAGLHGALDEMRAAQTRLADRLARMQSEDGTRVEAMKALESALGKVAAQIYEGESRSRAGLAEVRQDLSGISRRMEQLDVKVDERSPEQFEAVVSKIADRLEAAEGRTTAAVQSLEQSFAGLDERLKATETQLRPEAEADTPERRFERLAAELSEKVEASRTEMAARLREAADGKLDRMEAAIRGLAGHVETAERQSAQAIDRMGREVVRVAQTLGKRVEAVETRSASAVEQMGGEMARIADAMEGRMRNADASQAEALEKLGAEISKIAEKLSDRIAGSERRSAQAIEQVGDQVSRVTEKINQRYDRTASDLSERIKQSEERTAKILQEAQEKLDRRLLDAQRRNAIEAAVQAVDGPSARMDVDTSTDAALASGFEAADMGVDPFGDDPFGAPHQRGMGSAQPDAFVSEFASDFAPPAAPQAAAHSDFEDIEDFKDPPAAFTPPAFSDAEDFGVFDEPAASKNSTRDLIEAARSAARQAAPGDNRMRRGRSAAEGMAPTPAPGLDDEPSGRLFSGLKLGKRKKKEAPSTVRTALLASGTAAAIAAAAVGTYLATENGKTASPQIADATPMDGVNGQMLQESAAGDVLAPAMADMSDAAVPADAAQPVPASATPPLAGAPVAAETVKGDPTARDLYNGAVQKIKSGDNTGLESLTRAANLGLPAAQFYLAKLYETGDAGLKKNDAEARRWTERAAASGEPRAMHNLGLYYFDGTGGAKNAITAATWFRRAAEAGLKDSQYNLARLYEQGFGVATNAAEAYKWYLIAAAGGDPDARASAERLKAQLSPDSQALAERTASSFRAQAVHTAAQ